MGYLSCNSKSAIITCDPYNWDIKNRKKKKKKKKNSSSSSSSSSSKKKKDKKKNEPKIKRFSYSDLESATGGFSPQSFLGKGSHGSVYKAVLDQGKLTVAVKKTTQSMITSLLQDNNNVTPVDNEIEILSKIQSPRLVNLLGFSLDSNENKLLVVEFMPNGSLSDLLHSNIRIPNLVKRVRYALQVAKAVEILHSSNPPVIHRDIKSSNVLIDGNWNARLGDFGLALRGFVEDVKIKCTPPAGTLGYLDPGYIAPENLTAKNDVFSFGILLLEILSGRNAIDVNYSPPSIVDWALPLIKQGEFISLYDPRIDLPDDLSVLRQLAILAARCVRSTAEKRPCMTEVVNCLRIVSERVCSPLWNNLRRRIKKDSSSLSIGHEMFDTSKDVVKTLKHGIKSSSLKNSKVSNVEPCFDFGKKLNGDRVGRSYSIGSISEIRVDYDTNLGVNHQLALVQIKSGLGLRMPALRLNKSRSLGVLQSTRLVHDSERGFVFQLVRNPHIIRLDVAKLVVSKDRNPKKKMIEGKKSI
ncbi:Protein kinase domain [Macleaya cordata]|uniref:Protein kinase domain n=1 Tax=Macleaya cordata TaxID=56857 RepID=A0A200PNI4_MACCD|nr:Protein kinase domain [Macleaya cordata]